MRRLSIIDLGGGRQPIYNESGDISFVFNGEIYNFAQLRSQLEKTYQFRTRSDTEVLVHGYEEWGEGLLDRLRGMFAFAIWDCRAAAGRRTGASPQGRLLLARDRLGIKPLYYVVADGALLFASEVRALLASGAISRKLDHASVRAYLLFGSVVEPTTAIDGVRSLPPGHLLRVECERPGAPEVERYWN
jgi:asparagine synthase (glutamine-hydrolysing)